MERERLMRDSLVLGGAAGAAMPISRANKLGFCGATSGGVRGGSGVRDKEAQVGLNSAALLSQTLKWQELKLS